MGKPENFKFAERSTADCRANAAARAACAGSTARTAEKCETAKTGKSAESAKSACAGNSAESACAAEIGYLILVKFFFLKN